MNRGGPSGTKASLFTENGSGGMSAPAAGKAAPWSAPPPQEFA